MTVPIENGVYPAKVVTAWGDDQYGTTWSVTCGKCKAQFSVLTGMVRWAGGTCKSCRTWNLWEANLQDLDNRGWHADG